MQFGKFQKLSNWKIRKICDLENSKNFQFGTLKKNPEIVDLENSKNVQFGKFQNILIWKIKKKIQKLSTWKIKKNVQFEQFQNLQFGKF